MMRVVKSRPVFTKELFDLQFLFANRVCALSGMAPERALLRYTNFYVRLGLGRAFDLEHPGWQSYITGLNDTGAADPGAWTYRCYLQNAEANTAPPSAATFGCFSYAISDAGVVRLHFRNTETDGDSSLGADRADQRRAELAALFGHLRQSRHAALPVVGVSWLYNLDAYRRLFPAAYVQSARVVPDALRSMSLWGQFVDRHGRIKESMTQPFLASLERQTSREGLNECFPFQVLTVRAPAPAFYDFYGLP